MSSNLSLTTIRKWVLFLVGIIVLYGSFVLSQKIADSNPPPRKKAENTVKDVYVRKVENKSYQIQIPSNGVLMAYKRISITARVQGVMKTINPLFKTGQSYKAGQTLVQIESADYESNVIAQRAALFNLITSVLPDLQLDFPLAYPMWVDYLKKFNVELPAPKLPEMDESTRLFVSGRGIISNFYTLQNLEQNLIFYKIKAPFSGVLITANATEGSLIRPGQLLGEFIKPGEYELMVSLPKSYVDKIAVGAVVELKSIDTKKVYQGTIARINAKVNRQTQTVEVYIRVNDSKLREGMYLEAEIDAIEFKNVFAMDRGLLNGDQQIYIVKEGKLILKKIEAIHFTETLAIVKGLENGAEIVAQPIIGAYEGMEVNPTILESTN